MIDGDRRIQDKKKSKKISMLRKTEAHRPNKNKPSTENQSLVEINKYLQDR